MLLLPLLAGGIARACTAPWACVAVQVTTDADPFRFLASVSHATDDDGWSIVVWEAFNADSGVLPEPRGKVLGRRVEADGTLGPVRTLETVDLWDSFVNPRGHLAVVDGRRNMESWPVSVWVRANEYGNPGLVEDCDDPTVDGCPLSLRELRVDPAMPASPVLANPLVYVGALGLLPFDASEKTAGIHYGLVRERDALPDLNDDEAAVVWTLQDASIPLNDQDQDTLGWEQADELVGSSRATDSTPPWSLTSWPNLFVRFLASGPDAQHHGPWDWWDAVADLDRLAAFVAYDNWAPGPDGVFGAFFTAQPAPWVVPAIGTVQVGNVARRASKSSVDALFVTVTEEPRLAVAVLADHDALSPTDATQVVVTVCADVATGGCASGVGWEPDLAGALAFSVPDPATDLVKAAQVHWVETRTVAGALRPTLALVVETKEVAAYGPVKRVWFASKACIDLGLPVDWSAGWTSDALFAVADDIDHTVGPVPQGLVDSTTGGSTVSLSFLEQENDDETIWLARRDLGVCA